MKYLFKRHALAVLAASSFLWAAAPSQAADYPSKPISIVVGYPAGGSVDFTARVLGEALSERLGQSVVIENMGGAGGTIGANRVARATADGYTLLVGSTNEMVIAGMINSAVRYDGLKDFTPIGMIAAQPMMLAASLPTANRPGTGVPSGRRTRVCASVASPAKVPMSPTTSRMA